MYKIIGADGKEYGPASAEQLRQWVKEGRADAQTRVLAEGGTDWKPLSAFPEIASSNVPPTQFAPPPPDVPNYLTYAILTTLCCCLPFGIPAIVYAAQVNTKLTAGDYNGARAASDKAKMWCWIAFGLGIVVNIIGVVMGMTQAALIRRW